MIEHVIILAGGTGTRLWPASRIKFPKQFLSLGTGPSFFQETLKRAAALKSRGMTIVVSLGDHVEEIEKQWNELFPYEPSRDKRVILPEPIGRNTAPAMAYAAAFLQSIGEGESSLIALSSDHVVEPAASFKLDVQRAHELALQGFLVVFGIPPTRPETGYGYVERGSEIPPGFRVVRFHEKPDTTTAHRYLEEKRFFWNSGMFAYRVETFLEEMQKYSPDIISPFRDLSFKTVNRGSIRIPENLPAIRSVYDRLPSISIDYALMEKSKNTAMIEAGFLWSDVGSWDEVSRHYPSKERDVYTVEAEGNYVFSDIPVALSGVRDLIVVVKNGMALVCRRGSSQLVRSIVEELKTGGNSHLL